jgi:hypothetical protein
MGQLLEGEQWRLVLHIGFADADPAAAGVSLRGEIWRGMKNIGPIRCIFGVEFGIKTSKFCSKGPFIAPNWSCSQPFLGPSNACALC